MKGLLRFSAIIWCWMCLLAATGQAQTNNFSFIVTPSTNAVALNGNISFTVILTNLTGFNCNDVLITNTPSIPELLLSVTNNPGLTNSQIPINYFTNTTGLIFDFGPMLNGAVAGMTVTYEQVNTGVLTNFFQVAGFVNNVPVTNTVATNIVTQVYSAQADLAVAVNLPISTVITNDFTYFTVSVTNLGPGTATDIAVTNTLPPGFMLVYLYPTNQYFYSNSDNQVFYLSSLASGGFTNITYEVIPTNFGAFTLSASVGSQDLLETNIANNYATAQLVVTNFTSQLTALVYSPATVNYQNGLLEQTILVHNPGPVDVSAVRVAVAGLTNQLFNAVGTNLYVIGTNNYYEPFVIFNGPLAVGQNVQLLLQFSPRGNGSFSLANSQLSAYGLFASDLSPPPLAGTSTNLNFTQFVKLPNGKLLLEFPGTAGKTYTVVYSDNVLFSNAMIALPVVTADANEVQWIDYGPPATVSLPTNTPARFYRVYQNP